jgi:urease accessory protein
MYAATSWSDQRAAGLAPVAVVAPAPLPRAEGRLEVAFRRAPGGRTALARLHQQGSAKARLPRPLDGEAPELVMINLAGGVTGGDVLHQAVAWQPGAHAVATTQAAEKIYRASPGAPPAAVDNVLSVSAGAVAEWLPQETILFDGAKLRRGLSATLAADARLLAAEALVFGRTATGETVRRGWLQDGWRLRIGGRLAFADGLRFDGEVQAVLDRPAVAGGGRALATVVYAGPDAERLLAPARAALADGTLAAVSRLGPVLVARFIAADGDALRPALAGYLAALRRAAGLGTTLPKLWRC